MIWACMVIGCDHTLIVKYTAITVYSYGDHPYVELVDDVDHINLFLMSMGYVPVDLYIEVIIWLTDFERWGNQSPSTNFVICSELEVKDNTNMPTLLWVDIGDINVHTPKYTWMAFPSQFNFPRLLTLWWRKLHSRICTCPEIWYPCWALGEYSALGSIADVLPISKDSKFISISDHYILTYLHFTFFSVTFPTAPKMEVIANGSIVYSEVVCEIVCKLQAYVEEMVSDDPVLIFRKSRPMFSKFWWLSSQRWANSSMLAPGRNHHSSSQFLHPQLSSGVTSVWLTRSLSFTWSIE